MDFRDNMSHNSIHMVGVTKGEERERARDQEPI